MFVNTTYNDHIIQPPFSQWQNTCVLSVNYSNYIFETDITHSSSSIIIYSAPSQMNSKVSRAHQQLVSKTIKKRTYFLVTTFQFRVGVDEEQLNMSEFSDN